ncbi:MAG: acyltransferase family protein [Planctomycetota bacterium]|jgi:predicted acyltransferase
MAEAEQANVIKSRVASIDALRGFDMFWIIGGCLILRKLSEIYDNPSAQPFFAQFRHVEWEGFHFLDLIFPLFMFIVGAVLPFSIARRRERGESRLRLWGHIIKRAAIIVLLGLMVNGLLNFNIPEMRWSGVLQYIGVCYFFAALIAMYTSWRIQAIITVSLLILHWALLMFVPVPGFGAGVITPEGCLASYLDQLLIPGKLYYGYGDNEGILAILTGVALVLIGTLAGYWLRTEKGGNCKTVRLLLSGVVCLVTGYTWGLFFPIIKIIWTSPFILVASGWSLLLLALFYWVIDVKGYKKWTYFFVVIGMNPITIYFAQRFVDFERIAKFFVSGAARYAGAFEPVVLAIGILAVKWLLLWFLYRKRIFLKV